MLLGEFEHVPAAGAVDLEGHDLLLDVPDGRGGARHVVEAVNLAVRQQAVRNRLDDVVLDERIGVVAFKVRDVPGPAGREVVDADDLVSLRQKEVGEV